MQKKTHSSAFMLVLILVLTLTNYHLAKFFQNQLLALFPNWSYNWMIIVPWFLICFVPVLLSLRESGVQINAKKLQQNWKELLLLHALILIGLFLFVIFGFTKYFHSVKSPFIFFIITPIVEELLFRGWIYGQLEKRNWHPVIISAALFGLHHLQYFRYIPTPFAIFQMTYTFGLGIVFGQMRHKSDSIYSSLLSHMVINWVTVTL